MQEVDNNIILEEQQERDTNFHEQNEGQLSDESIEEIQVIKEVKEFDATEEHEEANKNIVIFLRAKGLSDDLVKTLINTDLTDEYVRLLKALDFDADDIRNLQDLWQVKNQARKGDSSDSSTSDDLSLEAHLSQNSLYLKNFLSKPLTKALREIIATKPTDPVEYLGHWLLHFKICEEQSIRKKEEELELLIEREKLRIKKVEDKEFLSVERKEEEELGEDRDHFYYGESRIDNMSDL